MERHRTELEGQTGHNEYQPEHQDLVLNMARHNRLVNHGDVQRAGGTIQHRHAVEQKARGHGT